MASSRERQPTVDVEPLMASSRIINAVIVRSMASVDPDLTVPQLRVLVILAEHDRASLSRVAEELGVNPSTASRTCEQLVQRRLVRRDADPADRRRVALRLDALGTSMLERVMDRRRELLQAIVVRMAPSDQQSLMAAADVFNTAANELGSHTDGHRKSNAGLAPWLG